MTEAEQIAELKKELQQQQEQINALKASRINSWQRVLIYGLILICIIGNGNTDTSTIQNTDRPNSRKTSTETAVDLTRHP